MTEDSGKFLRNYAYAMDEEIMNGKLLKQILNNKQ